MVISYGLDPSVSLSKLALCEKGWINSACFWRRGFPSPLLPWMWTNTCSLHCASLGHWSISTTTKVSHDDEAAGTTSDGQNINNYSDFKWPLKWTDIIGSVSRHIIDVESHSICSVKDTWLPNVTLNLKVLNRIWPKANIGQKSKFATFGAKPKLNFGWHL